ncbi:MAG: hypothetical protein EOP88_14170 [Verrucomicrobiaceae bacterium]|nr:MAG: hypothetical protein EOP88_14170 [Verrucomicrobiaceae bacterium]
MMNPVPFLSREDRLGHGDYVVLARKLHEFDVLLSRKFKTRADLIEALVASKIYSREEIDRLADPDCQDTNLLFDDGGMAFDIEHEAVFKLIPSRTWEFYKRFMEEMDYNPTP